MFRCRRVNRREFFAAMTPGWILGALLFFSSLLFLHLSPRVGAGKADLCLIQRVAGTPCPLCGGTTASILLARGDIGAAFIRNPLVSSALLLFTGWALLWLGAGLKVETTLPSIQFLAFLLILLGINWIYILSRNSKVPSIPPQSPDHRATPTS